MAIQDGLLGGYACPNPDTGFPAFAFRIHQFVSRGDTAYATIEPETTRYVTVQGQQFVPGDRDRVLLPLVFCRECGQEYYSVRMTVDADKGRRVFTPRPATDLQADADERAGFLHVSAAEPWPTDPESFVERLPDDWLEEHRGVLRVRPRPAEGLANSDSDRPGRRGRGERLSLSFPTGAISVLLALRRLLRFPAPFRFRQTGNAQQRGQEHGDDDSVAHDNSRAAARGFSARACSQTPELHRLPTGCQPSSRPL